MCIEASGTQAERHLSAASEKLLFKIPSDCLRQALRHVSFFEQISAGMQLSDVVIFIDQNHSALKKPTATKAEYLSEQISPLQILSKGQEHVSAFCLGLSLQLLGIRSAYAC